MEAARIHELGMHHTSTAEMYYHLLPRESAYGR